MSQRAPGSQPASRPTRRYPRYPLDARIVASVFRAGTHTSLWGRSCELGEDGIGGTLSGDLEVGEVVAMEFSVPGGAHSLKIRAAVRYRDGFRCGFEFLAMSEEQREMIRQACALLAQLQ
jgi:hypothetical protein